jgi:hypothetical protein
MTHDTVFDSPQNKALLVVCARKTIRNAAILGIVWGAINLVIGFHAMQVMALNAGIFILGLLMFGAGVIALKKPSLHCLLGQAVVSALLLCWNVGITIFNVRAGYSDHVNGHGLIWPLIAAIVFVRQYKRLGHLKDAIVSMDHATVKEAAGICKQLFKSKLKESPDIVQTTSKRHRLRLMNDSVLCVQRNLATAFNLNRADFSQCIKDANKKSLRVVVCHPLGKLNYAFDKKNSEKIKTWLGASAVMAVSVV